ncbi:MAG: hypothetical protein CMI13_02635 [Oleibacter sp.]|nr:hypothetical protein [Thalassolituus sp.]
MTKKIVNGIPTAYQYKYSLGRTGIQGTFKKHVDLIDKIYDALKRAEAFRALTTSQAIARLRDVRKGCNVLIGSLFVCSEREKEITRALKLSLDQRISDIATLTLGVHTNHQGKEQYLETLNNRVEFEAFYDKAVMNGQSTGRQLGHSYRYERATSMHWGESLIKSWLESGSQLHMNTWLETVRQWAFEDGDSSLGSKPDSGVEYLTEQSREAYCVWFSGGLARHNNNELFHTGNLYSSNAGDGWGIYVVDFFGNFYVGSHRINKFHHSSFFSGAPVLAGGEIAIHSGKVVGLTNKTGHYKARAEELNEALDCLYSQHNVDMTKIVVNDPFNRPGKWFKGVDAMAVKGKLTDLNDEQAISKPLRIPA